VRASDGLYRHALPVTEVAVLAPDFKAGDTSRMREVKSSAGQVVCQRTILNRPVGYVKPKEWPNLLANLRGEVG
jgi:hypothetical protein